MWEKKSDELMWGILLKSSESYCWTSESAGGYFVFLPGLMGTGVFQAIVTPPERGGYWKLGILGKGGMLSPRMETRSCPGGPCGSELHHTQSLAASSAPAHAYPSMARNRTVTGAQHCHETPAAEMLHSGISWAQALV